MVLDAPVPLGHGHHSSLVPPPLLQTYSTIIKNSDSFEPEFFVLELCAAGSARERDDVADVLHSCYEQDQALKAKTESGVRA